MFSRLSIRARITLGSLLVAIALLVIALVAVRFQVAAILSDADMTLAQSDLTSFQKDIAANPTESVDDPGTGVLVYVRNPSGQVQVDTLPHDVRILVQNADASDQEYSTTDDEGRTFVVVGRVVSTSAGDWALWSARSTSSSQIALEGLDRVLWIGGLALLAGFGVASWLLTTAALRPVNRMRKEAESLGSDLGDGELPVGRAHDELAALAITLNDFLSRVRESTAREKQMISDAAHELRTPLAALKTQLELAHNDIGDAAALAAQLRAAETSVDRLVSLASNLLELSRLESHDNLVTSSRSEQLVDELMGSVDRARLLGLAKTADIGFELGALEDERRYPVDPQAFGRLADNLLSNAIAAIGQGGHVTAHLQQNETGIVLDIQDDGPGMPETFVSRAFTRFARPDSSRTASTGGSGLGLALVQAIAQDAGGTATLRNTHPGLRVTVSIPKM